MLKKVQKNTLKSGLLLIVVIWSVITNTTSAYADRWRIAGNVLYFDMGYVGEGLEHPRGLEKTDVHPIQSILFENPSIDTISVTGPGGYSPAADEIIAVILRHGISTTAFGDCISACANIFLAGENRSLLPGARLGFHRPFILKEDEFAYFKANKESKGWHEEFDYVPWIYDVGLTDMLDAFNYMVSRGVSLDFISRAYSVDSYSVWFPTNKELEKGGVLNPGSISSVDSSSN